MSILNVGGTEAWMANTIQIGGQQNIDQLIKSLFSNNEVGFAYDPNDLTTMWQDQAKLLPVTGEGQPVWHILDKSGNNNHAFATSSATRPILQRNATTGAYYLAFDGADDFLQTNNIDFTSTDKVSLFAGVRKLSDAATGIICELGNNSIRSFRLYAPAQSGSHKYAVEIDASLIRALVTDAKYSAPNDAVILSKLDRPLGIVDLRLNTVNISASGDKQLNTFGNYPLYIGRRGGTTLPFNGHLYSLIGIGRLTTDAETIALEKSIAKNTGVTLSV